MPTAIVGDSAGMWISLWSGRVDNARESDHWMVRALDPRSNAVRSNADAIVPASRVASRESKALATVAQVGSEQMFRIGANVGRQLRETEKIIGKIVLMRNKIFFLIFIYFLDGFGLDRHLD